MSQKPRTTQKSRKQNQEFKTLLILGTIAVVILLGAVAIFNRSQNNQVADRTLLVREDSPKRGDDDAKVTLVEFLDPECETCRAAYPIVEDILDDYDGQIQYVVRYLANHYNSMPAIAATEAAGNQGKYWEMQEILFANQLEWGEQNTPQLHLIVGYATTLGLDMEQFMVDIQNPEYLTKVERDRQDAVALGVQGTPTFYINGQVVFGINEKAMRDLIESALR